MTIFFIFALNQFLLNSIFTQSIFIMKLKNFLLSFLIIFSSDLLASDININQGETYFSVIQKSETEFTFINSVSDIKTQIIKTEENDFLKLIIPSYGSNSEDGTAELPVLQKLIRLPYGSDIVVKIINTEEETINLSDYGLDLDVFPNQPSVSKSANLDELPFYYNKDYYSIDKFTGDNLVFTELLGKMRHQQLARLTVSPIRYNPVKNQIKIITKAEVKVVFKNASLKEDVANRVKYYSPEFESLFKSCINYTDIAERDLITTYPVKYVIISDPQFQTALQPLIDWKKKKGFLVVEEYTNNPAVGNTTTSIHAFIKDLYNNPTDGVIPTYLLIVGDDAQVPSFNAGQHVSDMYFCEFDGNGDFYPEMYYGRFSATTPLQVENQVNKTLTHEQYTFADPSFLDDVVLVAGVDASFAPIHGNGQINYGTDYYFNTQHGLNVHTYLYGSGSPITSDMSTASSAIISDISNGTSFANYTAHCGTSGWSDPAFENSDVSGLQNNGRYGLLIGNCCQSNKFDVNVCFGEKLLRENGKGAVAYIGGSNNTYWDEDFWWAVGSCASSSIIANPNYGGTDLGVYDAWMHENGEAQSDWFFTAGQMIHSGNLAVTQAGGSEQYYWEIYHLMGDPSLMPYLGVPTTLTVSHANATPIGTSTLTVTTEENAYVALSMNGLLLDAQLVGPSGLVNLTFPTLSNVGNADIVITKQFKQPYINTINVISSNAPFITYNTHTINDPSGNNNLEVDYNELIELDVELHNIGSQSTNNVDVVISTPDSYVTLIDSTDFLATVSANNTINISSPFTFQVSHYVPDQHIVMFNLTITDNQGNTWNSNLSVTINAPVLGDVLFTIDDVTTGNGNGKLDAGETLDLIVDIENSGHADISNLNAVLSTVSSYITVNNPVGFSVSSLTTSQQQSTTFSVTIDASTPMGTLAEFFFDLTDGIYSHNNTFSETVGIIDEDYETGDFTQYNWIQGNYPWVITNNNPHEGTNCTKSAFNLPDNQESELSVDVNVLAPGDISFYKKVSSEQGYDFLKFKINGQKVGEWSGIDATWTLATFPVNAGQTVFKWEYDKDGGWSEGQDCAFIDYIVFPAIDLGSVSLENNIGEIKLFPNPTMGSFKISFSDNKIRTALVYDINGKLIYSKNSNESISFDISDKSSGTYTVKVLPEGLTYQIVKN